MTRAPEGRFFISAAAVPVSHFDVEAIAERILAASDRVASMPPITDGRPDFDLDDAYRVAAAVTARRLARDERPVGWKIGFTNTTIWDEYGVHAPIWGPMWDTTVGAVEPESGPIACGIAQLVEPRIEAEIALRLAAVPHPDMEDRELLACVDGVAHGCEIVQSVFPGWRFRAADTVAAFALHGRYLHGPFAPVLARDRDRWLQDLAGFAITLYRYDAEIDRGIATNVLGGGPLAALRHLVRGLALMFGGCGLRAGDLVTTGTVTRAFPVRSGEVWGTRVHGLPLPSLSLVFT